MNIFISYAREDQQIAGQLYQDIKNQGYHPWLDIHDIIPGQKWEIEIKKALKVSDFCLVLLSENSISKRGYVQKEIKIAIDELDQFPESDIYLIPVRLDNCELPMQLSHLNAVDIFPHYEDGLNNILKAFQKKQDTCHSNQKHNSFDKSSSDEQKNQTNSDIVNMYISYSSIDNANQWVDTFANNLQKQIKQRLGGSGDFSIQWDRGADSDSPQLPEKIIKQIEKADMLIAIISPAYLNSDKCTRERHTFFRAKNQDMVKKLVVIEREKMGSSILPKEIQHERPHKFWIQEQNQRFPKILGEPKPDPINERDYFSKLTDLSFEIKDNIKDIAKKKSNRPITEAVVESSNAFPPVFLAEVTEDLLDRRHELEQYLKQQGFKVVPQKRLTL